jgi:hypothetical protein
MRLAQVGGWLCLFVLFHLPSKLPLAAEINETM